MVHNREGFENRASLNKSLLKLCRTIGAHQPDVPSNQLLMLIEGGVLDGGHSRKGGCSEGYRQNGRSPDRCRNRLIGSRVARV